MKIFGLLFLLTMIMGCDPYGFGFKKNPAYVLNEAFNAIINLDELTFLEMTAREALCVYGNEIGLTYLKNKIIISPEKIKINPEVLKTEHFNVPKFVGYWSYYHERYAIKVSDKTTGKVILNTVVDCEYGTEGGKEKKLVNQEAKKYKKKECKIIKIIPKTFQELPVNNRCQSLRVTL